MKEYKEPHSFDYNHVSGKDVGAVPALAGAVGALAGGIAAGMAMEGGRALGKKLFGTDIRANFARDTDNLRIELLLEGNSCG